MIPATKESHDGALTLTGSFVYGAGIADQYSGFNGGVGNDALPQPMPAPATPLTYTTALDGGLALFKADGTLAPDPVDVVHRRWPVLHQQDGVAVGELLAHELG